ncbi:MAG: type II restriction endonuclease [Bacteroidota bacterium]|nr:type II restriction endonuclease [Bacteroidota bacterium]MDE2956858.1 type II restriction endonuclease [Bacteroidota bacterium]
MMRVRGRPGPCACRGIPGPGILISRERTANYQITRGILEILDRDGNTDDLFALIKDRNLPVDDIHARRLAEELVSNPPELGYLTISNAQQRRLQYSHIIRIAGDVDGIERIT